MSDKEIKEKLDTIAYHTHWTRQNAEWIDFKTKQIKTILISVMIAVFTIAVLVFIALIHFW